jgi:addiction module HigA family antidote
MKKPIMPGTVLQGFLDEYHLSIPHVAEAIGLSQSALRQVLTNKAQLSLNAAARFAKYFNTTIAYWLELQQACDLAELKKDAEFAAALKNIPKAKKPKPAQAANPKESGKTAVKKAPAKTARQKPRTVQETTAPKPAERKPRSLKPKATTLYVAEYGNDDENGDETAPLSTVSRALELIRGKGFEQATIVISGSITQAGDVDDAPGMVVIRGEGLPPITLRGKGTGNDVLNAAGIEKRVLYIGKGNQVTLEEHLTLSGGQGHSGGAVFNEGTFIMEGGTISGNTAELGGGGVSSQSGTFTMKGGTISNNTTKGTDGAGGVLNAYGTFIMEGGSISDNDAKRGGGGVANRDGTFTMKGGTISNNTAECGGGGGVFNKGTFTIKGGSISDNTAVYGGGVYHANKNFTMEGGAIRGNSSGVGGGVHLEGAKCIMEDGEISDNRGTRGGGVYLAQDEDSIFIMKGGVIKDNHVYDGGGGVEVSYECTFTMEGGSIRNNRARNCGGGVDVAGSFIMQGGTVKDNRAEMHEGDNVYVSSDATFEGTLEDGVTCYEEEDDGYEKEEDEAVETARQRIQEVLNGKWPLLVGLDLSRLGLTDAMLEKALSHFSSSQLEAVTGPRGVDKVYLSENPITKVPAFIGSPTLFLLALDNTNITELPEWIGNMTELGELRVTGTPITELPESMGNLSSLRKLYIGKTKLQTVPEWLGKLTYLDDLSLRDLNITEVPAFIENLTTLTRLNLEGTEISAEAVPEYLIARVKAEELKLGGFYITKDPGEE